MSCLWASLGRRLSCYILFALKHLAWTKWPESPFLFCPSFHARLIFVECSTKPNFLTGLKLNYFPKQNVFVTSNIHNKFSISRPSEVFLKAKTSFLEFFDFLKPNVFFTHILFSFYAITRASPSCQGKFFGRMKVCLVPYILQ